MTLAMQDALRECVSDICTSIAQGSVDPGPLAQEKLWERNPDGHLRPRQRMRSTLLLSGLEIRPSFQACADRANTDPIVGPQLGQLVGIRSVSMQLTLDQIVRSLVGEMCSEDGRFEFNNHRFQQKWDLIARDLAAADVTRVTIAPLPGLVAPFPVSISPNIVIDRLTDEEVTHCVQVGILGPRMPGFELIEAERAVGLRCTESVTKVVGGVDSSVAPETGSFGRRDLLDPNTTVKDVLTALRLFKQGEVSCPGEVSAHQAWLLQGSLSFRPYAARPFASNNYALSESETAELQQLWSDLTGGTLDQRAFLAMALRRFNLAFERQQLDDRIVDLMIAAESLFLHDAGAPNERGELRFRLALRAAKFVESPRYARRQVFNLMRKAYDVRSQVVHGGSIRSTDLPDKPVTSLQDFISALADVMRLGIRKTLTDPQVGQQGYWEELLFNTPTESRI